MRPEVIDVVLVMAMGLTTVEWLGGSLVSVPSWWFRQGSVPSPTGGGMSDVLLAALVAATVAAVGGAWRAHNTAIKEAEQRAYTKAQSEARLREAQAALDTEKKLTRSLSEELSETKVQLADCLASEGGGT